MIHDALLIVATAVAVALVNWWSSPHTQKHRNLRAMARRYPDSVGHCRDCLKRFDGENAAHNFRG